MTRRDDARSRYISRVADLGPELLRYFERRSPESAEDLLSEVLIVAWRKHGRIPEADEQARMWFYGVARNVLRTHARSRARQLRVLDALRGVSQPAVTADATEHVSLRDAVHRLPPDLREVIELAHWEELTLAQIGQMLRIPASTVRGRYQRARERLAISLEAPPPSRKDGYYPAPLGGPVMSLPSAAD